MAHIVDNMMATLKQLERPIDLVLKFPPGPARWRAAHDLLWKDLSFKNTQIYNDVVRENRLTREAVDKHGQAIGMSRVEIADRSFRNSLNIPKGAYLAITKADPNVFTEKTNAPKFFKEFKEYTTREIY